MIFYFFHKYNKHYFFFSMEKRLKRYVNCVLNCFQQWLVLPMRKCQKIMLKVKLQMHRRFCTLLQMELLATMSNR